MDQIRHSCTIMRSLPMRKFFHIVTKAVVFNFLFLFYFFLFTDSIFSLSFLANNIRKLAAFSADYLFYSIPFPWGGWLGVHTLVHTHTQNLCIHRICNFRFNLAVLYKLSIFTRFVKDFIALWLIFI